MKEDVHLGPYLCGMGGETVANYLFMSEMK